MGLNFSVPLPGPFSYSARLGGKSKGKSNTALQDIEQWQNERAIRDLYCPDHLRFSNRLGWGMLIGAWLLTAWVAGFGWASLLALPFLAVTIISHRTRARRRAGHEARLATGEGCDQCHKTRAMADRFAARRARANPLAQLEPEVERTRPIAPRRAPRHAA